MSARDDTNDESAAREPSAAAAEKQPPKSAPFETPGGSFFRLDVRPSNPPDERPAALPSHPAHAATRVASASPTRGVIVRDASARRGRGAMEGSVA